MQDIYRVLRRFFFEGVDKVTDDEARAIARRVNARYLREWRAKNPEKAKAINARYRAKKKQAKEAERNAENAND